MAGDGRTGFGQAPHVAPLLWLAFASGVPTPDYQATPEPLRLHAAPEAGAALAGFWSLGLVEVGALPAAGPALRWPDLTRASPLGTRLRG